MRKIRKKYWVNKKELEKLEEKKEEEKRKGNEQKKEEKIFMKKQINRKTFFNKLPGLRRQ